MSTFSSHLQRFSDTVGAVADWDADSPCQGWSAADVLAHVIDTQRDFMAERGESLGPRPTGTPAQQWETHRQHIESALRDQEVGATPFEGYFGPTTVQDTLDLFYGFDLLVHRWDIATADGQSLGFTPIELDQIEAAAQGFGPGLRMEGICGPALVTEAGASRQVRVLAHLGRHT
ncbi:maleylpyruvate isomerase family mycothiol-dependent enzyme [Ornithinimicrobium sp. Arc0846-15]|nr:maleylpyruvate isomerase family mycothiol-dependent enzyme [Ornithinimicrobium laminariae]